MGEQAQLEAEKKAEERIEAETIATEEAKEASKEQPDAENKVDEEQFEAENKAGDEQLASERKATAAAELNNSKEERPGVDRMNEVASSDHDQPTNGIEHEEKKVECDRMDTEKETEEKDVQLKWNKRNSKPKKRLKSELKQK